MPLRSWSSDVTVSRSTTTTTTTTMMNCGRNQSQQANRTGTSNKSERASEMCVDNTQDWRFNFQNNQTHTHTNRQTNKQKKIDWEWNNGLQRRRRRPNEPISQLIKNRMDVNRNLAPQIVVWCCSFFIIQVKDGMRWVWRVNFKHFNTWSWFSRCVWERDCVLFWS